jgi:hypothetical protein
MQDLYQFQAGQANRFFMNSPPQFLDIPCPGLYAHDSEPEA